MHLNTALYDYDSCLQCLVYVVIMATWVNRLPYSCHVVMWLCMHVCTYMHTRNCILFCLGVVKSWHPQMI